MRFRIGLALPIVQQVPGRAQAWEAGGGTPELVRIAQVADRLGFAWISCSDHVAVPASYAAAMGPVWYEPSTTLAYLAAVTKRVHLLSHVLVLPYRHPLTIAKTYATLDSMSGGRVILGVGSGHLKPEFTSLGVDHGARGTITDEYLRALRAAFDRGPSSFDGERVRWRDMIIAPRPAQQPAPPIWVGGNSRRAAMRAASLSDGWIPWEIGIEEFRQRVADISAERNRGGRADRFDAVAPLHVGRDMAAAAITEQFDRWTAAGATAFHIGVASDGVEDLVERLETVARAAGFGVRRLDGALD